MKIYFRHRNQVVAQLSPNPEKTYTVGRALNCDIQIPIASVSRYQGVLFFENNRWSFKNESGSIQTVTALTDNVNVSLKNGLEIVTDMFLASERTHVADDSKTRSKTHYTQISVALVLFILIGAALYYIQFLNNRFDSKSLMGFAQNKILKFELKVKKDLLDKIKKEAELTEEDFKETVGFCTGFLVEKNILLTAHHCISPPPGMAIEKDFILKTFDNREILPKRILGFDFTKDFVFLEVEGFNDNPFFKFTEKLEIGQKVFTIGNVAGEGLAIREGIVSGETEDANDPNVKYVRFSAAASPGNSGGPLLNEKGEVVALVSRKNMAENYNIGISFKDLKNGFNNFVINQEPKNIVFESKMSDLNFGGIEYYIAKSFRLPLIEKLETKPNLLDVLNNFKVEIKVPFEFSTAHENYFIKFHDVAKEKILQVSQLIRKEELPGIDWETQATTALPYVIPSATTESFAQFKLDKDSIIQKSTGLVGNSGQMGYDLTLNDWKKNNYYLYSEGYMATKGNLIEERFQVPNDANYLIYSSVKDSKESLDLSRFLMASPDFSILYKTPEADIKKREEIALKTMKDIFIGPEGAIVSLRFFPFLRPKAKSDFKIKDFPNGIKKVNSYLDLNNRSWDYYVADFYDSFYLELFCMNSLNATHCLTTFQEGSAERIKEELVKNFVNFELNEKYPMLDYISPKNYSLEAINNYVEKSQFLKGFAIELNQNKLTVKLKNMEYSISLNNIKDISAIRFIPGIEFKKTLGRGVWSGFGVQFIREVQVFKEKKFELCTAGVQFDELKYNSMLNKDDELKRSFRGLASEVPNGFSDAIKENSKLNKMEIWFKDLGKDEKDWSKKAYGTCQELIRENEGKLNLRVNYKYKSFKAE